MANTGRPKRAAAGPAAAASSRPTRGSAKRPASSTRAQNLDSEGDTDDEDAEVVRRPPGSKRKKKDSNSLPDLRVGQLLMDEEGQIWSVRSIGRQDCSVQTVRDADEDEGTAMPRTNETMAKPLAQECRQRHIEWMAENARQKKADARGSKTRDKGAAKAAKAAQAMQDKAEQEAARADALGNGTRVVVYLSTLSSRSGGVGSDFKLPKGEPFVLATGTCTLSNQPPPLSYTPLSTHLQPNKFSSTT